MASGHLFIVAAPSGTGKTSLVRAVIESLHDIEVSISHTTRPPRSQEQEGVDYFFVDEATFKQMIEKDAFLEHALVFGQHKGTTRSWVQARLEAGVDVILEIDYQGAAQIQSQFKDAVSIFILPPSPEELANRLHRRQQDDQKSIQRRLSEASHEISQAKLFNYIIINENFDVALAQLRAIVVANRCLRENQQDALSKILDQF